MKFVSLEELVKRAKIQAEGINEETLEKLSEVYDKELATSHKIDFSDNELSAQEVYFLLDLYQEQQNRVFSGWVIADSLLYSFLRYEKLDNLKGNVRTYNGHTLENQYKAFLGHFLREPLKKAIESSYEKDSLHGLIMAVKVTSLLPDNERVSQQRKVSNYIDHQLKESESSESCRKRLLSNEMVDLLNHLDDNYYATRIAYIDTLKHLLEIDLVVFEKVAACLKKLALNAAHEDEVKSFIAKRRNKTSTTRNVTLTSLFRNPLFYMGLLIIAVLVYILIPKDTSRPKVADGELIKRSGLDSLTIDDIKQTDTLLGYQEDSTNVDIEGQGIPNPSVNAMQIIDTEDTIRNEIAAALTRSMVADYQIQEKQADTKDCMPMPNSERQKFQMNGVKGVDELSGGSFHIIRNESSLDVYMLIFENKKGGEIFGSFIPANGKLKFNLQKGLRLVLYSGRVFTRFNPLLQKNGGYGSVMEAKKIDDRFTAHFCELNIYDLQLMSKSWVAVKRGRETKISNRGGVVSVESDSFKE